MSSMLKYPFGREKDKFIHECNKGSLKFYIKNLKLNNPKYDTQNIILARECLRYLTAADIWALVEEMDPAHPAFQMCNDSMNAITDKIKGGRVPAAEKPLPVIQLEPKTQNEILKEVRLFIDDLYKKASALQRLLDEHTDSGVVTRDEQHTPF